MEDPLHQEVGIRKARKGIFRAAALGFTLSFLIFFLSTLVRAGFLTAQLVLREEEMEIRIWSSHMAAATESLGSFWFWAAVIVAGFFLMVFFLHREE